MKLKMDSLLEKAVKNVENDRKLATELLEDVGEYLGESADRYKEAGMVAAKYLETLQRSNEQLVKIAGILEKTYSDELQDLTDEEKDSLYEDLEEIQKEDGE
jgi:hypothetical protein